jgi:NAD(P)-dependent dehydrogenase (short-subunit alcohol dehydrogenase family)
LSNPSDGVKGQRTVVVGASSGIGRGLAVRLGEQGATVVAAARRLDRLTELPGVIPVACDVTADGEVEALVASAVEHMGGLDALVYAAGLSRLHRLEDADLSDWQELYAINLFGAAQLTRAALPHLLADGSQGRAVYLSSDSADRAYPGLVIYGTSKAALSSYAQGLASEFSSLRVTEILVGPTAGTEVANHFDPDLFGEWLPRWFEQGFVRYDMLQVDDVAAMIVEALDATDPAPRVMATGAEGGQSLGDAEQAAPEDQSPVGSALPEQER